MISYRMVIKGAGETSLVLGGEGRVKVGRLKSEGMHSEGDQ